MNEYNTLNYICANEHFDTDAEFARKLSRAYDEMPKDLLINHARSNEIIARRVNNYCKNKNIKLEDYDGPLPFRLFVISQSK